MQQSRQQQNDFMLPYKLANELQQDRGEFGSEDFINVVEAFQAAGGKRAQLEAFDVFKKLSNKDLFERCRKICRLASLLKNIQINKR